MRYEDLLDYIRNDNLHAFNFIWEGKEYAFAGWWIICWGYRNADGLYVGDGDKEYDTIEEWLNDPMFNGKTIRDIWAEISEIDITPWD